MSGISDSVRMNYLKQLWGINSLDIKNLAYFSELENFNRIYIEPFYADNLNNNSFVISVMKSVTDDFKYAYRLYRKIIGDNIIYLFEIKLKTSYEFMSVDASYKLIY